MNSFIEIVNSIGCSVLINVSKIEYIYDSQEDPRYNVIIFMSDGSNIKSTESFKGIKHKISMQG